MHSPGVRAEALSSVGNLGASSSALSPGSSDNSDSSAGASAPAVGNGVCLIHYKHDMLKWALLTLEG